MTSSLYGPPSAVPSRKALVYRRLTPPGLLHDPRPHATQQRGRRFRVQYHQTILILAGIDSGTGLQLSQHLAFFLGDVQANAFRAVSLEHGIDAIEQSAQSDSFCR